MIPTVDRIHQSIGMGTPPDLGSTGTLLNLDRMEEIKQKLMPPDLIADTQRLEGLEGLHEELEDKDPDDMLGIDEELDIDEEMDLNSLAQNMSQAIDPEPQSADSMSKVQLMKPTGLDQNLADLSSEEESEDTEEEEDEEENLLLPDNKSNNKILIIAGIIVAIIIVVVIIINAAGGSDTSSSTPQTSQPVSSAPSNRYANDQLTPTDSVTYQDSMVIEKYFVLEQDSCTFIFEGYAEHARAFIKASVDLETYNKYKVGARVPITYERVTLNGKDYYMKVRII